MSGEPVEEWPIKPKLAVLPQLLADVQPCNVHKGHMPPQLCYCTPWDDFAGAHLDHPFHQIPNGLFYYSQPLSHLLCVHWLKFSLYYLLRAMLH